MNALYDLLQCWNSSLEQCSTRANIVRQRLRTNSARPRRRTSTDSGQQPPSECAATSAATEGANAPPALSSDVAAPPPAFQRGSMRKRSRQGSGSNHSPRSAAVASPTTAAASSTNATAVVVSPSSPLASTTNTTAAAAAVAATTTTTTTTATTTAVHGVMRRDSLGRTGQTSALTHNLSVGLVGVAASGGAAQPSHASIFNATADARCCALPLTVVVELVGVHDLLPQHWLGALELALLGLAQQQLRRDLHARRILARCLHSFAAKHRQRIFEPTWGFPHDK